MTTYKFPQMEPPPTYQPNEVFLIASGDSRLPANQTCWPAQADMERKIIAALATEEFTVRRAHPYDEGMKHGFIWNQRMGMDVFKSIPAEAPLIVAVAVWQYSYHVLAGLRDHRGPILTIANWSGQWPGLEREARFHLDDLDAAMALMAKVADLYPRLDKKQQSILLQILGKQIIVDAQGKIVKHELNLRFTYLRSSVQDYQPPEAGMVVRNMSDQGYKFDVWGFSLS